jgi:hypothetical protein
VIGCAQAILTSPERFSVVEGILLEWWQRFMASCRGNNLKGGLAAMEDKEGSAAPDPLDDTPQAAAELFGINSLKTGLHVHLKMNFFAEKSNDFLSSLRAPAHARPNSGAVAPSAR